MLGIFKIRNLFWDYERGRKRGCRGKEAKSPQLFSPPLLSLSPRNRHPEALLFRLHDLPLPPRSPQPSPTVTIKGMPQKHPWSDDTADDYPGGGPARSRETTDPEKRGEGGEDEGGNWGQILERC